MKALSIQEPWASKIAAGDKTVETRTWRTSHRGRLLLCASQRPEGPYAGRAFAVCELVDVRPMTPADAPAAACQWSPDRFSWVLDYVVPDVVPVVDPWPVKGQLGLYEVDVARCEVCSRVVAPDCRLCSSCENGGGHV